MNKYFKQCSLVVVSVFLICSCSSTKSSPTSKQYKGSGKSNGFPKVPKRIVPGGTGDNWRYLGKSNKGQMAIEIDDASIAKTSSDQYKFIDRKTIVNRANFSYQNFPPYKYNVSTWVINCSDRTYKISSTSIFDEYGTIIKSYDFSSSFIKIERNSIIAKEYEYVCENKYRNIGY